MLCIITCWNSENFIDTGDLLGKIRNQIKKRKGNKPELSNVHERKRWSCQSAKAAAPGEPFLRQVCSDPKMYVLAV